MRITYILVHLFFNVPPCAILYYLHRPLRQSRDVFRLFVLLIIAIVATTPWDSYLIRSGIWSYPSYAVLGPKLFSVPLEEYTFFVLQTYMTTTIYTLANKAVFHPACLPLTSSRGSTGAKIFLGLTVIGAAMVAKDAEDTYAGLILVWACPFLALLWYLSGPLFVRLPPTAVYIPLVLPTLYLWCVDTFALRRGIWVISTGSKSGIEVWKGLEIEEALFFCLTNLLLTLGSLAVSHAFALLDVLSLRDGTFAASVRPKSQSSNVAPINPLSSPLKTMRCLLRVFFLSSSEYPTATIAQLHDAGEVLRKGSRSFHLASALFGERCRMLLLAYYSFCRVTDNLVDNASTHAEAEQAVGTIRAFIELCYPGIAPSITGAPATPPSSPRTRAEGLQANQSEMDALVSTLPEDARPAFSLFRLLVPYLPPQPLYDLLAGYQSDLIFTELAKSLLVDVIEHPESLLSQVQALPIKTEADLIQYSRHVAGSVGVACTHLMFAAAGLPAPTSRSMLQSASDMGVALQLVNIARDILDDARQYRCYIPTCWSADIEEPITPTIILALPASSVGKYRPRLLTMANSFWMQACRELLELPKESQLGAVAAVETYMAIGTALRDWKDQSMGTWGKLIVLVLVIYSTPLRRVSHVSL